jgi:hypothetical protein
MHKPVPKLFAMKLLLSAILATVALAFPLCAQVIYSGEQNLAIGALDQDGVYINLKTGDIAIDYPSDFDEGPWINFTLGGYGIFNGAEVRPIAVGHTPYDPALTSDYYVNVPDGTFIDDTAAFVVDGFGSEFHIGNAANQFVPGELGIVGFALTNTSDSSLNYGWLRFLVGASGNDGVVVDWAYEATPGSAIQAGAVPEPSAIIMIAVGAGGVLLIRRRLGMPR